MYFPEYGILPDVSCIQYSHCCTISDSMMGRRLVALENTQLYRVSTHGHTGARRWGDRFHDSMPTNLMTPVVFMDPWYNRFNVLHYYACCVCFICSVRKLDPRIPIDTTYPRLSLSCS